MVISAQMLMMTSSAVDHNVHHDVIIQIQSHFSSGVGHLCNFTKVQVYVLPLIHLEQVVGVSAKQRDINIRIPCEPCAENSNSASSPELRRMRGGEAFRTRTVALSKA
jgi:hypothetical protein